MSVKPESFSMSAPAWKSVLPMIIITLAGCGKDKDKAERPLRPGAGR